MTVRFVACLADRASPHVTSAPHTVVRSDADGARADEFGSERESV